VRILTFTTLYPNAAQPRHGLFVEHRLRRLLRHGEIEAQVVAPIPWFPFGSERFGSYARYAAAPARENRFDIEVQHPRYLVLPKIGMSVAPLLLARAGMGALRRMGASFDLIDAHYFYPDGVAAALIARRINKPLVITARGSDINLLPQFALPRRWIRWAAGQAAAVIAVSQALKNELLGLDIDGSKVTVLRNGVDLELFRPMERRIVRDALGLRRRTLLCVGNLLRSKGQDIAIKALTDLPGTDLLLVGEGPDRGGFESLARSLDVAHRVRFVGGVPQEELSRYYSAADILVHASMREGWPNVLLEAMACGTPVVASSVGGAAEIVRSKAAGLLVRERSAAVFAETLKRMFADLPDRAATRHYAETFGWDEIARTQTQLYRTILKAA
jgi:teichuronic acid biosynthesis glycosyltransferase TuaC